MRFTDFVNYEYTLYGFINLCMTQTQAT